MGIVEGAMIDSCRLDSRSLCRIEIDESASPLSTIKRGITNREIGHLLVGRTSLYATRSGRWAELAAYDIQGMDIGLRLVRGIGTNDLRGEMKERAMIYLHIILLLTW